MASWMSRITSLFSGACACPLLLGRSLYYLNVTESAWITTSSCSANCTCAESSRRIRLPINAFERALPEQGCAEFPTCPTDRHSHASPGSHGTPPRSCLRSVLCCAAGSGGGRTRNWKSSPFAISYCCLRYGKRPQLQIHARMPAQGACVMQFCDSCLYLSLGQQFFLPPIQSCNSPAADERPRA